MTILYKVIYKHHCDVKTILCKGKISSSNNKTTKRNIRVPHVTAVAFHKFNLFVFFHHRSTIVINFLIRSLT